MTGALTLANIAATQIRFQTGDVGLYAYPEDALGIMNVAGTAFRDLYANIFRAAYFRSNWNTDLELQTRRTSDDTYISVARAIYGTDPYFEIPTDVFFKLGKDSDGVLPEANLQYRGKMIFVHGIPDKIYVGVIDEEGWPAWKRLAYFP